MTPLRRFLLLAAAAVLAGAVGLAAPVSARPASLTLIHVNDWDQMAGTKNSGGAARIATVVAEERAKAAADGGLALVTFGGDLISPSILSAVDQGAHMIDLANTIGFDIAVPGNHEFDFGPDVLEQRLAESGAVWLAGNVKRNGRLLPGTAATTTRTTQGYRIGFVGLVTTDTPVISSPGPDTAFEAVPDTGARLAAELRTAGADLVIALTHQGLAADLELLRRAPAIDVVLGGHDHLLVARHDGRQAVMKAGSQGHHVAVLNLVIDDDGAGGGERQATWTPDFRLRSTAGIGAHPALAAKLRAYGDRLGGSLDAVVGLTASELDTRGVRSGSGETAFGNLLADALREATGSDLALVNGGTIRGDTVYPAGTPLTRRDLLTELPFRNRTVVLRLTGAELRAALENGVSRLPHPSGRFPHVSGLSFSYAEREPPGRRVRTLTVNGAPVADSRIYTLATNDFLARGGDGYGMFARADRVPDAADGGFTTDQFIRHVAAAGTVSPTIEGRITPAD